ncbi:MAG: hypothetical protein LAO55_24770 [Acidobacteriia bacterium]|nr:hypothetical protein [Terriglobia bacterium]
MKLTVLWPAFTVALEGTVRFPLLLESPTTNPPAGAGAVTEIVHCVVPGVFKVVGEHASPLNSGIGKTETVPATPAVEVDPPNGVAAITPVI